MSPLQPEHFHHSTFRQVLYFEWAFLFLVALVQGVQLNFAPPDPTAPDIGVSLGLLLPVLAVSLWTPNMCPPWQRLTYVLIELVFITASSTVGISQYVFPLYMCSIAKAALLLDRRGLTIVIASGFLSQIFCSSLKIMWTNPGEGGWTVGAFSTILGESIIITFFNGALMILLAMVTLAFVSEKASRLKAERLGKEVESLATELERTRIAREIHDSLGHTLTSLNIQLEVARKLSERDPEQAHQALTLAKQLAGQTLSDVRQAVQSIRSPNLNLMNAVPELVSQLKQLHGLDIQVEIHTGDLPPSISYHLYRITQECLTNVVKHARARQVRVDLHQRRDKITLSISDDGKGMPTDSRYSGFGIKGITERTEALNGQFSIYSEPDFGTRIEVIIPLESELLDDSEEASQADEEPSEVAAEVSKAQESSAAS
jgi:signal transduction histidine kinase